MAENFFRALSHKEWEDEPQPAQASTQHSQEEHLENRTEIATEQDDEPRQEGSRPKWRHLDRKDGHRLVKDTTGATESTTETKTTTSPGDSVAADQTTTLEIIREPRPIITAQSQRGKGVFPAEREVLRYPDIPYTAHEFGALLQFGTT